MVRYFSFVTLMAIGVVAASVPVTAKESKNCKCGTEKDPNFCCMDLGGTYYFGTKSCTFQIGKDQKHKRAEEKGDNDRLSSFERCCYEGFQLLN